MILRLFCIHSWLLRRSGSGTTSSSLDYSSSDDSSLPVFIGQIDFSNLQTIIYCPDIGWSIIRRVDLRDRWMNSWIFTRPRLKWSIVFCWSMLQDRCLPSCLNNISFLSTGLNRTEWALVFIAFISAMLRTPIKVLAINRLFQTFALFIRSIGIDRSCTVHF